MTRWQIVGLVFGGLSALILGGFVGIRLALRSANERWERIWSSYSAEQSLALKNVQAAHSQLIRSTDDMWRKWAASHRQGDPDEALRSIEKVLDRQRKWLDEHTDLPGSDAGDDSSRPG